MRESEVLAVQQSLAMPMVAGMRANGPSLRGQKASPIERTIDYCQGCDERQMDVGYT